MIILLLLAINETAPPAKELIAEQRHPLAMLVISGDVENKSAFSVSELAGHVSTALRKHTSLYVLPDVKTGADETIAACNEKHRLSCWARAVRNTQPEPHFLLAVSVVHDPTTGDRVATLLINIDAATQSEAVEKEGPAGWEDRVEEAIFQRTPSTNDVVAAEPEAVAAYFESLITTQFRPDLEAGKYYESYGSIAIGSDRADLEIFLDGVSVGTTAAGVTLIRDVLPGRRAVRVARIQTALVVETKKITALNLRALQKEDQTAVLSADLTLWTGVGLAAAGTILTVWALAGDPRPEIFDGCFNENCAKQRVFATVCELTERDASCSERGGALAAPLGYSLALTGGTWALGTALFNDEGEMPWLPFVIGLAAGAVAYGVSAALDGSRPGGVD